MNEEKDEQLRDLRRSGARLLTLAFWFNVPVLLFAGISLGSPDTVAVAAAAGLLSVLPTWLVFGRNRFDAATRLALGVTAVSYPALFVFLFRGHLWQMDMHMYFFAALASLTVLCDKRPIIAAAGLTALHHLVLNFVAPSWVFSGSGDIPRVLLHAVIVIMQTAVLVWLTERLQRAMASFALQVQTSEALRGRAEDALAALENAQRAEEQVRAANEAAERRRFVADEIEERFGAIVDDLGRMAARLSQSKDALAARLEESVKRSEQLRSSHERAEEDVRTIAAGTEDLSASINEVGRNSDATRATVSESARVTRTLPEHVAKLDSTVDAANGILRIISAIAAQSNILALNATIEAARGAGGGKQGFIVVANEIKTLSDQTAGAVEQITAHLEDIRAAAMSVADAVSAASENADTVDRSAGTIARVVQEQVVATSDLAAMAEQMASHVALAAAEAHEMAGAITHTRKEMDETGRIATAMEQFARELHGTVHGVLAELRAA